MVMGWEILSATNSAGLFVASPTLAMSLPAKITVGVFSVSETSTKNVALTCSVCQPGRGRASTPACGRATPSHLSSTR